MVRSLWGHYNLPRYRNYMKLYHSQSGDLWVQFQLYVSAYITMVVGGISQLGLASPCFPSRTPTNEYDELAVHELRWFPSISRFMFTPFHSSNMNLPHVISVLYHTSYIMLYLPFPPKGSPFWDRQKTATVDSNNLRRRNIELGRPSAEIRSAALGIFGHGPGLFGLWARNLTIFMGLFMGLDDSYPLVMTVTVCELEHGPVK